MGGKKERIGLVLASIHTGAALNVWYSFVKAAIAEEKTLFIFPGGRLNAKTDSENLRNSVYSLVSRENLAGCISWSSTVRYTESIEEFERFHSGFDPLPYVTLAHKIPGHPCVAFDAYTGVKQLVSHSIRVHGARKIAFLRGPDFHESAMDRFRGFSDAMKEEGLPLLPNDPLVSDPFSWHNGDAAAAQLYENRKLKPGRDFDTLIGSSDLMTLGAVNYFSKQGFHMPQDYHALGFNNSAESRLTGSPLSTVNIPYSALSRESFRILMKLTAGKKTDKIIEDIILPSEPIIRESCGCIGSHFLHDAIPQDMLKDMSSEDALTSMVASYLRLSPADTNAMVEPVIRAFLYSEESFLNLLEKAIIRFINSGRDTELFFGLIETIARSSLVPPELTRQIEPLVYRTIIKITKKLSFHSQYEKEKWNTALNSLKCELLGTRDRNSLVQSLARHLPKIGINTAGIALYSDYKNSIWVGSFSPGGISPISEQPFPSKLLTPEILRSQFSCGIFMVQPLFIENQSLGYFVHTVPIYDGVIFEELRSAVSYALKGIFLLENPNRAKRIAKQAEKVKTEFTVLFVGNREIMEPFKGLKADQIHIPSMSVFNETIAETPPQAIVFSAINAEAVHIVRHHPITVKVPIIIVSNRINSDADVMIASQYSRLLLCHSFAVSSPEFQARFNAILRGAEILPPHTGAHVKKTILYMDQHAGTHISRWKIAEAAFVNEDYLTRIFHREMGLPLWDYLNMLRVFSAANLLKETQESIQEIAFRSGFQDHTYFCRVFKKIYGIPPGQLRK